MNYKKILQYLLAAVVITAMVYFFYDQFKRNWDSIQSFHIVLNPYYLSLSFFLIFIAFLIDTYIWKICVNHYLKEKVNFPESLAFLNTSNLFKYIPGRILAYTVQIALMSRKNIAKSLILYVNFVTLLCVIIISTMYGLLYLLFYLKILSMLISILIFASLFIADVVFIVFNTNIINWLIIGVNRFFRMEIQPIKMSKRLLIYIQFIYVMAYIPVGIGIIMLARGIGINISFSDSLAVIASMAVSWTTGYLAIFTPGGLGVREGIMFLMLKQFSNVQCALIIPIASRLLYTIIEAGLGGIGLLIGIKYKIFSMAAFQGKKKDNEKVP